MEKKNTFMKRVITFQLSLYPWDYMSNRNPHVGACVSSTALYTCCLGLGFRKQGEIEFNIVTLLRLCMCLG